MTRLPDNTPFGDYTIHRFIKAGLYNDSYIVKNAEGVPFFMKFYDTGRMPDQMLVDGTVEEIVQCRGIAHPGIIRYVADGSGKINGRDFQYLVTYFFNGKLLSEVLREGRKFTASEAKAILIPILDALAYLNEELDLNHNDLTPRNILLETSSNGIVTPIIIDLGHTHDDVSGAVPFPMEDLNPFFLAPEALMGTFNEKSDIFSLGAILFNMLTGQEPWHCNIGAHDSFYSKKISVGRARQNALEYPKGANYDPELAAVIDACLNFDPAKRPDASVLLKTLSEDFTPGEITLREDSAPRPDPAQTPDNQQPREDQVVLKARQNRSGKGGFADVAGMNELKEELLKRVIWVLQDKEKAAKYRLLPPNGMLLYGPPGCGKTFFAKKFAEESGFNYYLVNGSDLGSTYIHGTQGKIADLFKKAEENAPSVICFDEFDSFVPARGSDSARNRAEEVNEFLSQLNNCAERGVFVIGTTNRIDMIDPAVLRKGRMDLKYEIPAPDAETRRAMFAIHLKGRPIADDVDLNRLALLSDGYASSDIAFIVNESAMVAALADECISQRILEESLRCNPSSLAAPKRPRIGFDN